MELIKSFTALQPLQKIFLLIAIATIFCSVFTDCILCRYYPLTVSAKWKNPFEGFDDGSAGDTKLYAFTAKWCRFCRDSQGEFDKLSALYANGPIKFEQIDAEANSDLSKQAGVKGYPTISLYKNGAWTTYTGDRTADAIKAWADAQ